MVHSEGHATGWFHQDTLGRTPGRAMTEIVRVNRNHPDAAGIARAEACVRRGGLVAFPTETAYGLGVHVLDREAVLRLFDAKGRPANDPLIVHVSTLADAEDLVVEVPPYATLLANAFWPGPLTLIMRRRAVVPAEVSAEHVLEDLDGRIDMVLDGGATDVGVESTVLDLTVDPPVVLRPSALSLEALRAIVPSVTTRSGRVVADEGLPFASPGLLSKHYAPRAHVTLYRGATAKVRDALRLAARDVLVTGKRVGILTTQDETEALRDLGVVLVEVGPRSDENAIAARIYAALRECDAAGVDVVLAHDITRKDGLWRAIGDRLRRAATSVVLVE